VRPGGYFLLEGVEWERDGNKNAYPLLHRPDLHQRRTREILQNESDAFFVDTLLGHSSWEQWQKQVTPQYALDRFSHNSHVAVIRRRSEALRPVELLTKFGPQLARKDVSKSWSLEALCSAFRTDKCTGSHKYVDVYAALFDKMRQNVKNFLEVGVQAGSSIEVWLQYFPNANIHGIDVFFRWGQYERMKKWFQDEPRVHLHKGNSVKTAVWEGLPQEFDIIIDDGNHETGAIQKTLVNLWPLLRPGGIYVIEDIEWDKGGNKYAYPLLHYPHKLDRRVHDIFASCEAFFVDPNLGHRNWESHNRMNSEGGRWSVDQYTHNSHMAVLRKRHR